MDDTPEDGPGLTRLYKDGGTQDIKTSEVEQAMNDGWKDNPTDGAKSSPEPEARRKPGRPPKSVEPR